MQIKWNEVTWYSSLSALILFATLPFVGFYLGVKYSDLQAEMLKNQLQYEMNYSLSPRFYEAPVKVPSDLSPATSTNELLNVSDWKTYTNKNRNFSIKYPQNLSASNIYTHNTIVCFDNPNNLLVICIYDDDTSLGKNNDAEVAKDLQLDSLSKKLNTSIIGMRVTDVANSYYVYIPQQNLAIIGKDKNLLQQMLETLEILGPNQGVYKTKF